MSLLFYSSSNILKFAGFNEDISNWDVSNVTTMKQMFINCQSLDQYIPLWNWNVSNVVDFDNMFGGATIMIGDDHNAPETPTASYFTTTFQPQNTWPDLETAVRIWVTNRSEALTTYGHISMWDVSLINEMDDLFLNKSTFNDNISNWDVSNVNAMGNMFKGCNSFNQPIENWDVSKVTRMNNMFEDAHVFNGNISNWNTKSLGTMKGMFRRAYVFNQDISKWNTENVGGDGMNAVFQEAYEFNQPINTTQQTDEDGNTYTAWDISNVTTISHMFQGALTFNQSLKDWNVSNVTNMTQMFKGARDFNQDIQSWNWNVGENTILIDMFGHETIGGVVYQSGIYSNNISNDKTPTREWFNP